MDEQDEYPEFNECLCLFVNQLDDFDENASV